MRHDLMENNLINCISLSVIPCSNVTTHFFQQTVTDDEKWKSIVYYDIEFGQVLFPIESIEDSNRWKTFRIGQSKGCRLSSEQY